MTDLPIKIAALYKFVALPDCETLRPEVHEFCAAHNIRGTLLLAPEGINGTVAGAPNDIDQLIAWLEDGNLFGGRLRGAEIKYSGAESQPFLRLKVRLKSEIVTLRAPEADPTKTAGTYVEPEDWNALIAEDDVVLIDTRNDYEVQLGTFDGAIDPATRTFTEFKDFVDTQLDPARDKKVAMFCTGGIRCEKASSYLRAHGFEQVFHLHGGILKYLETVPETESKWHGECFVFDERVGVKHGLEIGTATLCRACRQPLLPADKQRAEFIDGVQCHHCAGTDADKTRRAAERQRQIDIAAQQGLAHLGDAAASAAAARAKAKKKQRAADRKRNTVK